MSNTIEQYRQAKNDYLKLRNQAKKELIARFHQVVNELFQIQRELLEDFGEKLTIPSKPQKSRASRGTKQTAEPNAKSTAGKQEAESKSKPELVPAPPSREVIALQKQVDKMKQKLAETHAANKPAKAVEDRLYELEDSLRLAQVK